MVVYPFDRKRFQADPVVAYFYRAHYNDNDVLYKGRLIKDRKNSRMSSLSAPVFSVPVRRARLPDRIYGKYLRFPDFDAVAPEAPLPSLFLSGRRSVGRECRAPSMGISTEVRPVRPPRIPSCGAPVRIAAVCLQQDMEPGFPAALGDTIAAYK